MNVFVSNFFNNLIALFGYKHTSSAGSAISGTWWGFLLNLLCTAVLPAFCEETLHRGLLMNGNSMLGMKKSIIISGFLFGLLHLNIEQFFYATIIGLFLGYLCWGCNSIYPCIIIHFMNNAMSVFFSFASARGWAIGRFFEKISYFLTQNQVLGFVLFLLVLALLVFVALELTRFLILESFNYNFKKRQKELAGMAIREDYFRQIEEIKGNKTRESASQDSMFVVDVNDFLAFVRKNIHSIMHKTDGLDTSQEKVKMQNRSKIFLYGAIALGVIVTIMTFIWGIL
ncbi:MAG: lysostaphin resistance A-like protein [Candidatus Caccovivens sp.]